MSLGYGLGYVNYWELNIKINKMKKTQKQIVLEKLEKDGCIDNVWCFQHFILRLGAIICSLKKEGYMFRSDFIEGTKNYEYHLLKQNNQVKI